MSTNQPTVQHIRTNELTAQVTVNLQSSKETLAVNSGENVHSYVYEKCLEDGNIIAMVVDVYLSNNKPGENILAVVPEGSQILMDDSTHPKNSFIIQPIVSTELRNMVDDKIDLLGLPKIYIFTDVETIEGDTHVERSERSVEREPYKRRRSRYSDDDNGIKDVEIGHLDDIITEAKRLKESDNPNIREDAYARMHFAISCLNNIEMKRRSGENHTINCRNSNVRNIDRDLLDERDRMFDERDRFLEDRELSRRGNDSYFGRRGRNDRDDHRDDRGDRRGGYSRD